MDGTSVAGSEPVLQDGNVDENSPSVGKPKLSREDLEEIFNALDINADGQISMIEFIKGLRADPVMAQTLGLPSDIRQVRPCSVNILAARAHMRLEHTHMYAFSLETGRTFADDVPACFWQYRRRRQQNHQHGGVHVILCSGRTVARQRARWGRGEGRSGRASAECRGQIVQQGDSQTARLEYSRGAIEIDC